MRKIQRKEEIHLKEGEVICSKCDGSGYARDDSNFVGYNFCSKCFGEGKLDWIDNILGKTVGSTTISMASTYVSTKSRDDYYKEIVERTARQLVEDIDREILKTIIEQCNLDLNKT